MDRKLIAIGATGAVIVVGGIYGLLQMGTDAPHQQDAAAVDVDTKKSDDEGSATKGSEFAYELLNKMMEHTKTTGKISVADYRRLMDELQTIGEIKREIGITEKRIDMAFAHVQPGEYSEVYATVTGLTPGDQVSIRLNSGLVDAETSAPQVADADSNGIAHFTWRISSYGKYWTNAVVMNSKMESVLDSYLMKYGTDAVKEDVLKRNNDYLRDTPLQVGYGEVVVE